MARLPRCEPLYPAFEQFLERCILEDRSLIWPQASVWTSQNVHEMVRRLVDAPILGGDSFERKLEEQMKGADPVHWQILCDVYYIYYLPSDFIKLSKTCRSLFR